MSAPKSAPSRPPTRTATNRLEGIGPGQSVRASRRLTAVRLRVVAVVAVVACAMLTSIVLYVDGAGSQRISVHGASTASGTTVTLDVVSISKTTTASSSPTSSSSPGLSCWILRPTVSSKTSRWPSHPPRRRSDGPGLRVCCPASSPFRSLWRATSNAGRSTATTPGRSRFRCSPARANCRNAPTSHSSIG